MKDKELDGARIEELAAHVWENTGAASAAGVEFADLSEAAKDMYRRIAAAVAEKLGFSLGSDVSPRPRDRAPRWTAEDMLRESEGGR